VALLCVSFYFALAGTANATPILDQQQPVVDLFIGGLAVGGGSQQALAQTVTAGISGDLAEVQLPVSCDPGSNLLVEIEGVSNGIPNNTVLASQVVSGSGLLGGGAFNPIDFSNPARIGAGSQFAIVLTSTGSCGIFQGPPGDSYSGGNLYFIALPNPPGLWVCNCMFAGASFDLPFKTLVSPIPVADVSIVKTGPASVHRGYHIVYALTVKNTGPATADNVTTSDTLPPGLVPATATPSKGTCTVASSTITCNLGSLTSGEIETVQIIADTRAVGAHTTTLSNTATASSTTPDPNSSNNSSTVTTAVTP
jgi:uncharacterized repeat protein (TIGR01451 family)